MRRGLNGTCVVLRCSLALGMHFQLVGLRQTALPSSCWHKAWAGGHFPKEPQIQQKASLGGFYCVTLTLSIMEDGGYDCLKEKTYNEALLA